MFFPGDLLLPYDPVMQSVTEASERRRMVAAFDPVLNAVPEHRRHTFVAEATDGGVRFDLRLQGEDETVCFDV